MSHSDSRQADLKTFSFLKFFTDFFAAESLYCGVISVCDSLDSSSGKKGQR